MACIYVYEHDCTNFTTTGLVGALNPLECYFEEEKNGSSGLSITMHYDKDNRWKALKVGNIIKAEVPVRVPPVLANGEYLDTVDISYVNHLDLQQFAIKMDLQKHADTQYTEVYGDQETTYIIHIMPYTGTGGQQYMLYMYSDGRQVSKIVGDKEKGTGTNGYTRKPVIKTDEQPIPQRFSGLESVLIPTRMRDQFFVIDSVIEGDESVEVTASHIWYQLLKNYTTYKSQENQTVSGYSACKNIMSNTLSPVSHFYVESDVATTQKDLDYNQKNIVEAFLDPKTGVCAKYNAVLLRDNWDFYVISEANVGYDRGFVVEYGQNMLEIERSESIENVATRVIPFGKDSKGNPVYMTGTKWVDSEHFYEYPNTMVELLDCSKTCTIGKDGTTAQNITEKLRAEAQKRFDDDKIDIPEVEMTVNFLSLGDSEEYAQYRGLDKVYLYDKITIKDKKRGYSYSAEVTYVKHNVITGMLEEVRIGKIGNSDGVRTIATWQVPQVSGENIRLKSIQLGSFADGAVDEDAIANGAITTIHLASATIDDLTTESLTAVEAQIEDLIAGKVTAGSIVAGAVTAEKIASSAVTADKIQAGAITTEKIQAQAITTGKIAANAVTANEMATGTITATSGIIANAAITNAMIGTGAVGTVQIADGSVTDAKIVGLTANKITAGTLDAGTIEVVNLNAANITVGKINGQQIATGTIALTNLASGVQTSIGKISGMESDIETLQREVDAAIETFYYPYVPTLSNIPASQWTTEALKEKHQGDLFFDSAHGQAYRFLKLNNVWQWKLIEDSAITDLLSRVNTLETNMETVQEDLVDAQEELAEVSEGLEDVASDLSTTKTNLQSVTGRLTTAEQTITQKADQSTVTSLSNTVSSHTESIGEIEDRVDTVESTVETKADASTVTTLSQTVASHTTSIGNIEDRVETAEEEIETKADASTVSTLSTTVASHTTSIGAIDSRVTTAESTLINKADKSTVNTLSSTVASHTTSINGITTRLTTAEETLETKADSSTVSSLSSTVSQHTVSIGEIDDRVAEAEETLETKADGSTVSTLSNTVAGHTTSLSGLTSRVTTAEQTLTTKADGSTVSALSTTVASHTTSLSGLTSRITAAEEEIEEKADGSTVTELSERVTEVEETTEGITSTVSALDTRVTTAQSTANSAQTTANSKTKVYSSGSRPTTGVNVGDLFIDTSDDNKTYRWTGSAWESVQDTHLDSTVSSHGTQIQQNATAIALKASQSDLSALTGRVTSAEATIELQADEIESKVSETDFTGATIASKINQSASTVQIEAEHINLVGAVTASDLAAGAVTADAISAGAVTTAKIATGAVTADLVASGAITSDKIVAGAVTSGKVAANAITANNIVSGAITTDKIDSSAITSDKIAANAITVAKLASNVGQGIDISANTYLQSTIGSWTATHTNTIVDEIAGINRTIGDLGRGQIFYSTTEPENPAVGDIWIKPTNRLTHGDLASYTHAELSEFRHMDLGKPPEQYVYSGTGWDIVNDSSMYTVLQTQLEQTDEKIALKASLDQLSLTNARVTANEAQLEIQAESITSEVTAREEGDAEAQAYADSVAGTAEANAKAASILKTTTYQTAEAIVNGAKSYTDDVLTAYSTITQTSSAISAEVTKITNGTTAVGKLSTSKVTIDANGIQLKTNGIFTVASGNFAIDASGNVTVKGNVQASSGSIGGWTIGTNDLHAGSGSSYVALATSGDYAIWAGNANAASAPFRVKRDGTVYSTKLIALSETGTEETINLRNYALWKLNYKTVKSVENGVVTLSDNSTFNTASSVRVRSITTGIPTVVYDRGTIYAFKDNASVTLTNGVTDTSKGVGLQFTDVAGSGLAYDAGFADGEAGAGFTKHDSTVYTISSSAYSNVTHFIQQGSGFSSIGTGFYRISSAATTWYTKEN